jgi:nickel-dependent lactate racemase
MRCSNLPIEVEVPNVPWHGDKPMTLYFPDEWDVKRCKIASEGQTALSREQVRKAILSPIGTKPLSALAQGKNEAVIIFDDMTRPTKIYQYAPIVLEELKKAGVKDDNIRFIIAAGSHGTYTLTHFREKLGEEIMERYPVFNHNPYEMVKYVGDTKRGTPVWINGEVMSCDLKIGIGTLLYHRMAGFSGGAKIICPGVAGIRTIQFNHGPVGGFGDGYSAHPSTGYLKADGNVLRLDMEDAARITGLDFKIDTVLNLNRDPLEVYAGDFVQTHRRAIPGVLKWHRTESPKEMDIVVANSYMRQNEADLGLWSASQCVKSDGSIVLMADDPDGDINHWIFHAHGKYIGASLWSGKPRIPPAGARLVIYGRYHDKKFQNRYRKETTVWCKTWEEVLEILKSYHKNKAKVAVLPDATSGIPETMTPPTS